MTIEQRITELGYTLPEAPPKGGTYVPCKEFAGNLAYLSGCGPAIGGENFTGKLGADVSFEDGRKAAENCVLNLLAVIKKNLGSLERVKSNCKQAEVWPNFCRSGAAHSY